MSVNKKYFGQSFIFFYKDICIQFKIFFKKKKKVLCMFIYYVRRTFSRFHSGTFSKKKIKSSSFGCVFESHRLFKSSRGRVQLGSEILNWQQVPNSNRTELSFSFVSWADSNDDLMQSFSSTSFFSIPLFSFYFCSNKKLTLYFPSYSFARLSPYPKSSQCFLWQSGARTQTERRSQKEGRTSSNVTPSACSGSDGEYKHMSCDAQKDIGLTSLSQRKDTPR